MNVYLSSMVKSNIIRMALPFFVIIWYVMKKWWDRICLEVPIVLQLHKLNSLLSFLFPWYIKEIYTTYTNIYNYIYIMNLIRIIFWSSYFICHTLTRNLDKYAFIGRAIVELWPHGKLHEYEIYVFVVFSFQKLDNDETINLLYENGRW